ncbi:U3 snoRNP protein [Podochytrium sp. JEL0797]|nr:U3 snoRNP protein [Podochytrium sp. JEL0797]
MSMELNKGGGANRYKFQTFTDRLKTIKIDSVHKVVQNNVGIHSTNSDAVECFFVDGIAHWAELNMTAEFSAFRRDVYHKAQSLEQILYHQKEIVDLLVLHLEKDSSTGAAEPLLNLVTLLARDLQEEFFPYFPRVLKSILTLIHKNDAKLLEAIFNSIAYLFKYLSREVSEDVLPTFKIFQTVFEDHRPYIRLFGAEAFGFIVRKVPSGEKLGALLKYIVKSLQRESGGWAYSEGIAILMLETLKQVRNTLHSRCIPILRAYVSLILTTCPKPDDAAFTTLIKTLTAIGHHITPETSEELWEYLFELVHTGYTTLIASPTPAHAEQLRKTLEIFATLVILRKGSRIVDRKRIFEIVNQCLVGVLGMSERLEAAQEEAVVMPLVRMLATLTAFSDLEDILVMGRMAIVSLFSSNVSSLEFSARVGVYVTDNPIYIFSFCEMLQRLRSDHLAMIVMPYLMNFLPTAWKSHSTMSILYLSDMMDAHFETKLQFVSHDLKTGDGCLKLPKQLVKEYSSGLDKTFSLKGLNWDNEIEALVSGDLTHPSRLASMGVAITSTRLVSLPFAEYFTRLETLFRALLASAKDVTGTSTSEFGTVSRSACIATLTSRVLGSLLSRSTRAQELERLAGMFSTVVVGEYLARFRTNPMVLEGVADFVEAAEECAGEVKLGQEGYDAVVALLMENVGSVDPVVRLNSLRIVVGMSKFIKGQDVQIFEIALECERIEDTLEVHREKSMLIKRIDNLILAKLVSNLNEEAALRYCLALLSCKFSVLHSDVSTVLINMAKRSSDSFWKFYMPVLMKTKQQAHEVLDFDLHFPELPLATFVDKKADTTCTNINRVENLSRKVTAKLHHLPEYERRAFFKSARESINRMNDKEYYVMLLKLLRSLPSLVEHKSTQLLPLYFELLKEDDEVEIEEVETDEPEDESKPAKPTTELESSSIRGVVIEFLRVFENCHNPRKMSEPERLYNSFLELLANGDAKLQQTAFNCILTWREPGIVAYADHLKGLADDSKFRDFLSTLDVAEVRNNVKTADQESLMQVLMRILYGKLISRRGRGSTKVGLKARRNAIFAFTVALDDDDRESLIDLMVTPFKSMLKLEAFNAEGVFEFRKSLSVPGSMGPLKFQSGFMNIIEDSIKQLKNHISPSLPRILTVILNLMNAAELELIEKASVDAADLDVVRMKQLKDIRQMCILRLAQLFNSIDNFDFTPYVPAIYQAIIDNRIPKFDSEHTQASSSLMDLVVAWSKKAKYTDYFTLRVDLVPKILGVLAATNVKEAVSSTVVGILESFLALDKEAGNNEIAIKLIKPNMAHLLKNFEVLLSKLLVHANVQLNTTNLTSRVIAVLAQTSQFVNSPVEAERLMIILTPCLRKRSQQVPEKLKVDILQILAHFVPVLPSLQSAETRMQAPYFALISQMFSTLEERTSRVKAVFALRMFSNLDSRMAPIVVLVENFNAYLARRIEEPDFNRRFDAFTEVGQTLYKTLDSDQWLPILHSLVHSLQDVTEFSIRTSAAFCLSKFIDVASGNATDLDPSIDEAELDKMRKLVLSVLLPSVKKGVKSNVELVRSEFMTLLGVMVKHFATMDEFKDLVVLLANGDEDAAFFSNIYHMQTHRRMRAMKRLSDICATGAISQSNVSHIFLPLVTHILFEQDRQTDFSIISEAINTIAACSVCLSWGKYFDLVKRFLKAIPRRPNLEKELIRVIVAVLDHFKFKLVPDTVVVAEVQAVAVVEAVEVVVEAAEAGAAAMDVDSDGDDDDEMEVDAPVEKENLEQMQRIHTTVVKKLIPDLFALLTKDDEENVNLRVPVAVAITKLLTKLSEEAKNRELPKLLTTVCVFLKNRLQDVRDGSRDALLKIAKELGPVYFPFIIKELQSALLRGYQLHVLGFTVHHLLVGVTDSFRENGFDTSVDMLARIFVNDIFGTISDEREVQEMNGKLKEMKRSKSYDSFELVAKVVRLNKITSLLNPLKEIMLESNSSKTSAKLQDILRRIVNGLGANSGLSETDLLVFVNGLITENLPLSKLEATSRIRQSNIDKRMTVQMKRNEPLDKMLNYFRANAYMFIDFGLGLLLMTLRKDVVRPNNPEHLKMMDPLVTVLAKSMYSQHSSVIVNSLKIFSLLAKWPLPSLETAVPALMKRVFELFLKKGDANAEKAEAALKLLGVIIKECAYVDISQPQIVTLIQFLTPELEEPDKQSAAFALIRSILNRKYIFPEIYDLMSVVTKIMVTSQGAQVRELCRQSYCQFLLEYPHGPQKLKKEFNYLIQNLRYEFESGRESVLGFFGLCLPKLSETVLNEYAEMILLSFVMVLINDESAKCREKASDMIKLLVRQCHAGKRETFLVLMEGWFEAREQPQLLRTAAQLTGLFVEASTQKDAKPIIARMIPKLVSVLAACKSECEAASFMDDDALVDTEHALEFWQAGYYTLNTFSKIFAKSSTWVLDPSCLPLWQDCKFFLMYPHTWVRSVTCRLFGTLFAAVDLEEDVDGENATIQAILLTPQTLSMVSMQLTKQLESKLLQEDHAKQVVKNLLYIGKCILQFHDDEEEVVEDVEEDEEAQEEDGEDAPAAEKVKGNVLLLKIFKRLAYIGRADVGTDKRKSVFQWFGAMILSMECEDFTPYLTPAMSVLYRTMNSSGRETDELKNLAKEISEHLQKAVGITTYLAVYNQIHTQVQSARQDRRTKRKVQVIVDPEAAAKRRLQKNEMKKQGKKRKVEEISKKRVKYENSKKLKKGSGVNA